MKTTQAQFKYFTGRVHYWAEKYGLHHIHIGVLLQNNPDIEEGDIDDCLAWAHFNTESSMALIGLNPDVEKGTTNATLNRAALHEVWEVVAWPVRELLEDRGCKFEDINAVIHQIIRRTETAQFGF